MRAMKKYLAVRTQHKIRTPFISNSKPPMSAIRKLRDLKRRSLFHAAQGLPKTHRCLFAFDTFVFSPILSFKILNWWHCLKIEVLICQSHDVIQKLFLNLKKKDFIRDHSKGLYSSATLTFLGVSNIHVIADMIMRRPHMNWRYTVIQKLHEGYRLAIVIENNKYDLDKKRDYQTIIQFDFVTVKLSVRPRKWRLGRGKG